MNKQEISIELDGKNYTLETGKYAKFADGAVMISCQDTMVLVTVVAAKEALPEVDFVPLQVEYREKSASAGKFPGGFLKREGRPTDREILISRLIDRPIRPLLPKYWNFEIQLIATVYSADPNVDPDTIAATGASAALMISDIPFNGPVSEVKVGRINGEYILNPSFNDLKSSDIDITVAGTDSSIIMVEGECNEISEDEFLGALEFAHEKIRHLNALQIKLVELAGKPKREFIEDKAPEEISEFIIPKIEFEIDNFINRTTTKKERSEFRRNLKESITQLVLERYKESDKYSEALLKKYTTEVIDQLEKAKMRQMILEKGIRLDGRKTTDIRQITCEVGLLPRTHGSSLFTRGETQSLSTVTLGTKKDEQVVDGLLPAYSEQFILHYNFPPFSTGEIKKLGLGRREIGHGNLALRALKPMIPDTTQFPYTIRIVSDILESNGSSSMATVCAGSLALFDAGVPVPKHVAGIAMGLIKEGEQIAILSDILGDEDHLGDMDFKVTGTYEGITACQMDIKIDGLSIEIMKKALLQAKEGREKILEILYQTIDKPRADLSPYAPRYTAIKIEPENIGAVIGSGGETIRAICRETETDINIDDDGTILIAATSKEKSDLAVKMIQDIVRKPEEGEIYQAKVIEIKEGLGAIVQFMTGKTGLLHISQISRERVNNVSDFLKVGDEIEVKLVEISKEGKYRLSRKVLLPESETSEEDDKYNSKRYSSNKPFQKHPPKSGGKPDYRNRR